MALFVDNDLVQVKDLMAIDPEVGDVANAEGITIAGEGGVIEQAWEECADQLQATLQGFSGAVMWSPMLNGGIGVNRTRYQIRQIVATVEGRRTSPLKRWMVYRSLVLFYRAAANRRESDRYDRKREQFQDDERRTWRTLFQTGLPVVQSPLPCPGATHEEGAGVFGDDSLTTIVGAGTEDGGSFQVVITWTNAAPLMRESGPSAIAAIEVLEGERLSVSIAGLTPPAMATGWNVYVGGIQQNGFPIPVTQTAYTLEADPVVEGIRLGVGQPADYVATMQNVLGRG